MAKQSQIFYKRMYLCVYTAVNRANKTLSEYKSISTLKINNLKSIMSLINEFPYWNINDNSKNTIDKISKISSVLILVIKKLVTPKNPTDSKFIRSYFWIF